MTKTALFIILSILLLAAAACNFSPQNQVLPEPTAINGMSSVEGMIWQERCEGDLNARESSPTPRGCKFWENSLAFFGNGILDSGEVGISGVKVSIGAGTCPADVSKTSVSASDGTYHFSDLQPGLYCVTANLHAALDQETIDSGAWTYPHFLRSDQSLAAVIVVDQDDLTTANFGWDDGGEKSVLAPVPTATQQPRVECTNMASFIDDLTIPDGTALGLGSGFVKTWRLQNSGTCAWSSEYALMFINGHRLNGPTLVSLPDSVSPGQSLDLSVDLEVPDAVGLYQSFWMLRDPSGRLFGVGNEADTPIWIKLYAGLLPDIEGWKAEYFANKELSGEPARILDQDSIDFDWKFGAPLSGLPANNFSVRWSQEVSFDAAIYRFTAAADDGIRLWIDGGLVIDQWTDGGFRKFRATVLMKKGKHDIVLEYYERSGVARVELDWAKSDDDDFVGWTGTYWSKPDFKADWALVVDEAEIDFDWGQKSPALGIPADNFSVRWARTLKFDPGRYKFSVRADDGIRLFIDGSKVLDEWHDSDGSRVYTVEVDLDGSHNVKVEYFEHKKHALIQLWWEEIQIPNGMPQGLDDAYATQEDAVLVVTAPGVLGNDTDPDGDTLRAALAQAPSHGQLELQSDGSFTYTPESDFNGSDNFTYHASDGDLMTSDIIVRIDVSPVNDLPAAVPDALMIEEDSATTIEVMSNDLGLGDDPLSIQIISGPSRGAVVINSDLSLQYQPNSHANGLDAFTYEVTDGDGEKSSALVEVTINPVDDSPEVLPDNYSTQQGQMLIVGASGILENDQEHDGEALQALLDEDVPIGQLTLSSDGSFTYEPTPGYTGTVSFSYRATDGISTSAATYVQIDVLP
jgi:hypothetical protein